MVSNTRPASVWLRVSVSTALSAGLSFLAFSTPGCSTDAVAVEECREIEDARCEAAAQCGVVDDVKACKRYYRDHCLHGLDVEDKPRSREVDDCTDTIRAAGACAAAGTDLSACDIGATTTSKVQSVCDVIDLPEETSTCAFLIGGLDPEEDAGGGAGGTAGAGSGGTAGTAGTGGTAGVGGAQ